MVALRNKRVKELIEDVASFSPGYEWDAKDKAAGIVRGVKILGYESCHGYGYTAEAMKNAAGLYEGRAINVDHPERKSLGASRSYRDRFGKLHNVRYVEGKGLFGDLHYNKKHAIAEQFEYDVEHDPSNLGLSHNASGVASADGKFVESITNVRSVDLVADPATNVSLFESKGERRMAIKLQKKSKSKQRLMAEFMESLHEHEDLAELLEAAVAASPDEDGSAMDTPLQATAKMAAAIFMDESMDVAAKRAKILKLLDLIDDAKSTVGADGQSGDTGAEGETSMKESKGEKPSGKLGKSAGSKELVENKDDIAERLARLERKDEIRSFCESKNFQPSPLQLKSLMLLEDDSEVKELIESWAGQSNNLSGSLGPKGFTKPKSKPAGDGNKLLLEGGKAITDDELKSLLV
jgi:hypothetical protein